MVGYSLQSIEIFSDIKGPLLEEVTDLCAFREFDVGEVIFDKGDHTHEVYFVLKGLVRVLSAEGDDHDVPLSEINAGEVFGEFAAFDHRARSGRAHAVQDTILGIMDGEDFLQLTRDNSELAFAIINMLIARIRTSNDRFTELAILPDKVRICREILRLSRPHELNPRNFILYPAPSHRELASWTGSSQQTVNDTIGWLLKTGIIERPRGETKTFIIRDFIKLKSVCEFNRYL